MAKQCPDSILRRPGGLLHDTPMESVSLWIMITSDDPYSFLFCILFDADILSGLISFLSLPSSPCPYLQVTMPLNSLITLLNLSVCCLFSTSMCATQNLPTQRTCPPSSKPVHCNLKLFTTASNTGCTVVGSIKVLIMYHGFISKYPNPSVFLLISPSHTQPYFLSIIK